jgi:riboflavin kinase/FMN adenylyltransferase
VTEYPRPVIIWRDVPGAATEPRDEPAVVTIGNFDGVHRGHQHLLDVARDLGGPVVAVTFDPHPTAVFAPDQAPKLLTTFARRIELLQQNGADEVRALAFDREMAAWPPEEFVRTVLVGELHAKAVVVGENFRYGSRASGDVDLLKADLGEFGCLVTGVDLGEAGGVEGESYSSTLVREFVASGRVAEAAVVLGRPHEVSGVVRRGDGRGKDLGFPTANVPVDEQYAVPSDGVYAGRLVVDGHSHDAAISVGTNPTFAGTERRVESFLIDVTGGIELYDRAVRVEFAERLRGMETFDSIEALVAQMHDDVAEARGILAR